MMVAHISEHTRSCSWYQSYLVYILVVVKSSRRDMGRGLALERDGMLIHNFQLGHSQYLQCMIRTFQYQCCILTMIVERILGCKRFRSKCTLCPLLGRMVSTFRFLGCTWHVAFHRWQHRRQQCCSPRLLLCTHRISWYHHCI
jgi:hypothetical protein